MTDTEKLLTFLRDRLAAMRSPLTRAIYAGLIARLERGDFTP